MSNDQETVSVRGNRFLLIISNIELFLFISLVSIVDI